MTAGVPDTAGLMITALESLLALGESLDPRDWSRPTDCPGWSVQDQFSHQCGLETSILGRDVPYKGPGMQPAVDFRRSWSPEQVLAEYRDLVTERTAALRTGGADAGEFLSIRVFDCWMHEQDVRGAVDRPGHLSGLVADFVVARCVRTLPMIVGKRAAPPDGTVVVFRIDDSDEVAIAMESRRANRLEQAPADRAATIALDRHALTRLAGGRRTPGALDIKVSGDQALASKILASMTVTP